MRRRLLLENKDKYEAVDLGIVVGGKKILWAKYNVGGNSETDYGFYYQYGKGSKTYQQTSGETDYTGTENPLAASADTATQVMGGDWHMPTSAQCAALTANTTYSWTTINGVAGGKFTASNGNYIFLPAAGDWYYDGSQYNVGSAGYYWSSTPNGSSYANRLYFYNGNENVNHHYRYWGDSVRGVKEVPLDSSDTNGHTYVDLGLPSGTLWATMNVGASSETDYGNYYKYGSGATQYSADTSTSYYTSTENPLSSSRDTAVQVWGGLWHMPTQTQLNELTANTNYSWTSINGVSGGKFTSKTDSSKYIFLPAAGDWLDGSQYDVESRGYCWSSSPDGISYAYSLYFYSGGKGVSYNNRYYGFSVRPVIG